MLIKKLFFSLAYSVALAVIVAFLFFPKDWHAAKELLSGILYQTSVEKADMAELKIGLITYPTAIEPTSLDPSVRNVALQIYEPLVKLGPYFQIQPGLALAWGRVSPTVWRIELRPDVVFHNKHPFTVDDVISSFNRAANYPASELKATASGLTLEAKGKRVLEITTRKPDPFCSKISQFHASHRV